MMYGKCRKVLDAICFLCEEDGKTSTLDIQTRILRKIRYEDLCGCIHVLERDGYIKILESKETYIRVTTEHKGQHYKEYQWQKIKEFLFKSILTPIVVALITTLITLYINGIFRAG